jgi:hypothetical protein
MHTRERLILVAAVAGVTAIAIAGAWSMSHHKTAAGDAATQASAPMSPHDITVKRGNSMPVEYWSHPF